MTKNNSKKVSIVMGSKSDFKTMIFCEKVLKKLDIKFETKIISAHRTPDRMYKYAKDAENNNISVIIAGAGGSAHLPGMISALTSLPVLGVPIESKKLKQKLNVAFDEVILLAKKNDSSFLVRFQEVYPNVCEKLLENNPKLVNTELTLCAMVWLNFSSKDIASYTHVQPKTVQTKKYRLRKKLNIPENINIYTWLKNL